MTKDKSIYIPYSQYYAPILGSFFKPHRCLTCIDHYGILADVCFGDIHIKPYSEDHIGISSWITRSEYWEKLFREAESEGYIHMDNVDTERLNKSQSTMLYPKKRRANVVMSIDQMLGRSIPNYEVRLENPSVKDYVAELVCLMQIFLGKHKSLWIIIDFVNYIKIMKFRKLIKM